MPGESGGLTPAGETDEDRVERLLTEIWTDVLEVPRAGLDDDFLDLGGNSLHAVRIVGEVEEALDIHLSVRAVLETRTIRRMAEWVRTALPERD